MFHKKLCHENLSPSGMYKYCLLKLRQLRLKCHLIKKLAFGMRYWKNIKYRYRKIIINNIDYIIYIDIMQIRKLNLFAVCNAAYAHGSTLFSTASMIVGWVHWDFPTTDAGSDSAVWLLVEEVRFFVLFSIVYSVHH